MIASLLGFSNEKKTNNIHKNPVHYQCLHETIILLFDSVR